MEREVLLTSLGLWARRGVDGHKGSGEARRAFRAWGPYRLVRIAGGGASLESSGAVLVRRSRRRTLWLVPADVPLTLWADGGDSQGPLPEASAIHRSYQGLVRALAEVQASALVRLAGGVPEPDRPEPRLGALDLDEVEAFLQRLLAVRKTGAPRDLAACVRSSLAVLGRQPRGGRKLVALLGLLRARFVEPHREVLGRCPDLRRLARYLSDPARATSLEDLADRVVEFLQGLGQELLVPGRTLIDRAIEFTRNSTDADLTMATVANYVSMNYSRFSQRFKEATGEGFAEYLRRLRIERSIALLRTSPLRVYEVAQRAGYQSTKYFMKVFKEQTGLSPTEFRQAVG